MVTAYGSAQLEVRLAISGTIPFCGPTKPKLTSAVTAVRLPLVLISHPHQKIVIAD